MLELLRIRNYALIDDLKVNYGRGFNVLTGETGAGKSIIIGALNIILGDKASSELIRTGEDKAIIESMFDVSNNLQIYKILDDSGIDYDKSEPLMIRREISVEGKNKNYINSTPVPLNKLKEIGDILVDIHGQYEHQSLLKVDTHIDLLDRFGKLDEENKKLSEQFKKYVELRNRLEKLQMNEQEKARLLELLKFSIDEIEKASLKQGEDIELEKEFNLLNNQEKIFQTIEKSYNTLYSDDTAIYSHLKEMIDDLADVEKYDNTIVALKQKLEDSYYIVEDVVSQLKQYKNSFNFSAERLESIIERIELINKLKKKYGATIQDITNYKEKCLQDLDSIERSDEEIEKTKQNILKLEKELNDLAIHLSGRRRVVAKLFEEKITEQLRDLDMEKSRFHVNIVYLERLDGIVTIEGKRYKLNEQGIDNIEFLISPNPGEELKPLRKIASGGEISRIMLALKIVLNEIDNVSTLIFDEIDVGIGGKTSDVVGKKMRFLSKTKQVISITHQAQIARYAEKHFYASKDVSGNRTYTRLKELTDNERIVEIARMIGGDKITATTLQHAKELVSVE